MEDPTRTPPHRPAALSPRQQQVLILVVDGLTDREIGEQLGISARTVRMHVDALRLKFGVERRRQLLAAYHHLASQLSEPPSSTP